jgi:hypothetical protein
VSRRRSICEELAMRLWMICGAGALLVSGGWLLFKHDAPKKKPVAAQQQSNAELEALQRQVDSLRGQVGTAQAMSLSALAKQSASAVASAAPPPEPSTAPPLAAPTSTPEQQAETFRDYFAQLDALRGAPNDTATASKVDDAVMHYDWKLVSGSPPSRHSTQCGNGYCRVTLSFDTLPDAETARAGLAMAAGPVLGRMSVYVNPKTLQVEGYFAEIDKPFPAFPDPGTLAQREP